MRLIDQIKAAFHRRQCAKCGGKGYVVDRGVDDFIQKYGLASFQVASTMLANEDMYGPRGSLGVSSWEMVGLPPEGALDFSTEVGLVHVLHACPDCDRHQNHKTPLSTAMKAIKTLTEHRQAHFREWLDTAGKLEDEAAKKELVSE